MNYGIADMLELMDRQPRVGRVMALSFCALALTAPRPIAAETSPARRSTSAEALPTGQNVELRIAVRSSGHRVKEAYVALVAPSRPWSHPNVESVADSGVATLRVPAGVYRLVAGTPDGNAVTGQPFSVRESREIVVDLPPMIRRVGTVRDRSGHPVAEATVADVNALIEAPLGRLTELAKKFFGSRWQTTTAADGEWSLFLPAGAKNPLVAEASDYGTAWHAYDPSPDAKIRLRAVTRSTPASPDGAPGSEDRADPTSDPPVW